MSAAPSEPEKYSIDEMLDRLKKPAKDDSVDGQRVIRADGTEAIRVRKRKRRSSQPMKEQQVRRRRIQIIQITAVMAAFLLVVIGGGGAVIYANSTLFRQSLLEKIGSCTGAKANLQLFRMNPKTANAGSLSLDWPDGSFLKKLDARGLTAELAPSSLLGGPLNGEEITVTEINTSLQLPVMGHPLPSVPSAAGISPIHFKRYRTDKFNLNLTDSTGNPAIRLLQSEASLAPNLLNGHMQLSLSLGDLYLRGWPKMRVDRAFMEFRAHKIDVLGLRFLDETDARGIFELSGIIDPYAPDRLSKLGVTLKNFPLSGLVGPDLSQFLSGRIDSVSTPKSNCFSFYPSTSPQAKLEVIFQNSPSSGIGLSKFPFLFNLSQVIGDDWFQNPVFDGDSSNGKLYRQSGDLSLSNLNFQSKGRMAIRGNVSLSFSSSLSGELEVGIPDEIVASAKISRLTTLFGPSSGGFRWITVKLGGTATKPTDNFKDQFLSPELDSRVENKSSAHQDSSFEELTRPKK